MLLFSALVKTWHKAPGSAGSLPAIQAIGKHAGKLPALPETTRQHTVLVKLAVLGYTRLYLLSGEVFKTGDIPSYLTVIRNDRIERIKILVD